ncbi:MAG: radical SAM protein [Polyangiaceae bacterium]
MSSFPDVRLRRFRRTGGLRGLVRETRLDLEAFVMPLFVARQSVRNEALPGVSRHSVDDVVREVEELVDQGVVEVNLISQDTIAYGRDLERSGALPRSPKEERTRLAKLVRAIGEIPKLRWIRIFYLYPETIDDELVDVLANHPRVVKYVDMPLQHASDAMLKRMRRGHGLDRQKRVVSHMREKIPGLTFRTAFIVGHPGETDAEFQELHDFVEWAEFEHVGVFRYSDEESCKSFAQADKVSAKIAANRNRRLMTLQRKIARKKNRKRIGQELDVLVEGASEEHDFVMQGRHAGQAPEIDGQVFLSGGEVSPGQIRRVRISQASDYDLVGEVIDVAPSRGAEKKRVSLKVIGASEYR